MYPSNCIKLVSSVTLSALKCELCEHGYYLVNGFCKQCDVKLGTLSKCDGLCPIDYYIESLLPTVNYGFQFLGGYFIILLLVVIL